VIEFGPTFQVLVTLALQVIGDIFRAENYQFSEFENKTLNDLTTEGNYSSFAELDDDHAEYLVPVKWLDSKLIKTAFSETGLFGNQNSVCKPTTPKWSHTIERLKTDFK